jgi:hypothetical protein
MRLSKIYLRIASNAVVLTTALGCSTPDSAPHWVEASDIDVAAFTTFGWASGAETLPAALIDRQIRDAIRAQLVGKGYQESARTPEFLVEHETLERDAVEQGNPVRIGIGVGSWGGNVGGSVGTSVDVGEKDRVVQELRVNIRVLARSEDREIWNGTTAPMAERPGAEAVERAVTSLMRNFPDRTG